MAKLLQSPKLRAKVTERNAYANLLRRMIETFMTRHRFTRAGLKAAFTEVMILKPDPSDLMILEADAGSVKGMDSQAESA